MKCFSMRMIFDLFHTLLNSEIFCFFHNCMWQSRYSESNFVLFFLIHQYGSHRSCLIFFGAWRCQHTTLCGFWSTYGSPCTCWVCVFIMFLLTKSVVIKLGTFLDFLCALGHIRVSPSLIIGFWVLVGFVGYLCCLQRHRNPNHTSNYLCRKFSVVVEVTHLPSGIWFLQISSQLLSRYNRLGVYRRGWLRSILFDRTSILSVEQAVHRPNTPYPGAFSTLVCTMQDVVWSNQALADLVILIHGIHGCKEYRLSLPTFILSSRYQSWICDGV